EIVLPSWAGFQSRRGAYGSVSSRASSDGSARLTVTPRDPDTPPLADQAEAFRLLLANESAVSRSVLLAIFAAYPDFRERFEYDEEEFVEIMPEIERAEQLRPLIGMSEVHILNVAKDGVAYIGFEFGCT